jgi:hypothetical protein
MKKIVVFLFAAFFVVVAEGHTESLQLGLVAGGDVVMADIEALKSESFGTLGVGGGFELSKGEYKIGNAVLALRNDQAVPGLRFGLGFKTYFGQVDEEGNAYHGTLTSLCFLGEIGYELTRSLNPVNIPVELYGGLCIAPTALCFNDTTQYQEYRGGLRFYLLENAFVSVELMYRRINFNDTAHGDWTRDDAILTGGVTLRF